MFALDPPAIVLSNAVLIIVQTRDVETSWGIINDLNWLLEIDRNWLLKKQSEA